MTPDACPDRASVTRRRYGPPRRTQLPEPGRPLPLDRVDGRGLYILFLPIPVDELYPTKARDDTASWLRRCSRS